MSQYDVAVLVGEVVPPQATLVELTERVNQEHQLVADALSNALDHVVKCGQTLSEVRELIGQSGTWESWLDDHFTGGRVTASYYMRIYVYRDMVQGLPNVSQAMKRLQGMPVIRGGGGTNKFSEEVKEEARALFANGVSKKEISTLLDVNRHTVARWVDPEILRRHQAQVKAYRVQTNEKLRLKKEEAAHRAAEREAKRVGGALGESYSLVHKLETSLALAERNAEDPEVRRLLTEALRYHHKAFDNVVSALGMS